MLASAWICLLGHRMHRLPDLVLISQKVSQVSSKSRPLQSMLGTMGLQVRKMAKIRPKVSMQRSILSRCSTALNQIALWSREPAGSEARCITTIVEVNVVRLGVLLQLQQQMSTLSKSLHCLTRMESALLKCQSVPNQLIHQLSPIRVSTGQHLNPKSPQVAHHSRAVASSHNNHLERFRCSKAAMVSSLRQTALRQLEPPRTSLKETAVWAMLRAPLSFSSLK